MLILTIALAVLATVLLCTVVFLCYLLRQQQAVLRSIPGQVASATVAVQAAVKIVDDITAERIDDKQLRRAEEIERASAAHALYEEFGVRMEDMPI